MSELLPVKHLCQQLQAEQAAAEKSHREELEQSKQAAWRVAGRVAGWPSMS